MFSPEIARGASGVVTSKWTVRYDMLSAQQASDGTDLKHILVTTDGSELAGKAVAAGIRLAVALHARLTFVTVTPPLASLGDQESAFASMPEAVRHQALAYLGADADRTLSAALSAANKAGVNADALKVENRHPHEAIIAAAQSRNADLIVMASHGRSGIKAVLLGSVTQKVLVHSALPVLVCPATEPRSPA